MLLPPRVRKAEVPRGLTSQLVAALATRYDKSYKLVQPRLSNQIAEWGTCRIFEGDTLHTSKLGARKASDSRDATYVRVSNMV
jgi:hypothetical protein